MHTKSIFARHSIPKAVKKWQYSVEEYKRFIDEWRFKHVASLYNSQANGLAEKSVQIVKQFLRKAKLDENDPYLSIAILVWIVDSTLYCLAHQNIYCPTDQSHERWSKIRKYEAKSGNF